MNLKSFRALQIESPRTAMIFDLTERFPRGPAGKLRKKDYAQSAYYEEPKSEKLIGGALGYDLFELYALCSKSWWENDMLALRTTIEGAAMGRAIYLRDETKETGPGSWEIFKRGPQVTRRIRRLQARLRAVKTMVEAKSTKNIYNIRVGSLRETVACFGQDQKHAEQTFDLLLRASFEGAGDTGLFRKTNGWGRETDKMDVFPEYHGPAHGPHEIMVLNNKFSEEMRKAKLELEEKIKTMQSQIAAVEQLADMVDNFTLSTCAAFTEDMS